MLLPQADSTTPALMAGAESIFYGPHIVGPDGSDVVALDERAAAPLGPVQGTKRAAGATRRMR